MALCGLWGTERQFSFQVTFTYSLSSDEWNQLTCEKYSESVNPAHISYASLKTCSAFSSSFSFTFHKSVGLVCFLHRFMRSSLPDIAKTACSLPTTIFKFRLFLSFCWLELHHQNWYDKISGEASGLNHAYLVHSPPNTQFRGILFSCRFPSTLGSPSPEASCRCMAATCLVTVKQWPPLSYSHLPCSAGVRTCQCTLRISPIPIRSFSLSGRVHPSVAYTLHYPYPVDKKIFRLSVHTKSWMQESFPLWWKWNQIKSSVFKVQNNCASGSMICVAELIY